MKAESLVVKIMIFVMTLVISANATSSIWKLLRHGVRGDSADPQKSKMGQGLQFCSGADCTKLNILGTGISHSSANHDTDEKDAGHHISWKNHPQKGKCFDSDLGYAFDCRLVEILDEGLVLIEDLRAGGVFAAQPKSQYSTRAGRHQRQTPPTPTVMLDLHSPSEDFRTNVQMNLEGL